MARLSPNPHESLLLPMTIFISTLPQINTPSTTLPTYASALIVVLLSSSPPPVSRAYPATCSKNMAAIQDLWTGSTHFRLCRMSRGWFSICPDPGDQWGSGISQRLIPLERTSTILNSYLVCRSSVVLTGCHEWLLWGHEVIFVNILLQLCWCFLRCFVSILLLWSMPIPGRFVDDVRTLLLLLSTPIHYARTLIDQ